MQFNNLNRYRTGGTDSRMTLAMPLPRAPSGRISRYSPNALAEPRSFMLGGFEAGFDISDECRARMKLTPRSDQSVCPYSGVVGPDEAFTHPDDVKAARETIAHAVREDAHAAVADMMKNLKSQFRHSKTLQIKPGPRRTPRPKPTFVRNDLLRELVCDHCSRDYGVYAIGLFCPDCGAPNVRLHFQRERSLVGAQVALAEAQGEGLEELAYRLLGNAHEDVLTAFESTLKTLYLFGMANRPEGAAAFKPVKNDFQNVDFARRRFTDLETDPFSALSGDDIQTLKLNIQKRHIIGHNLGVVDTRFAEHAREAKVGETVTLVAEDIRTFAALCQSVIDRMDEWLAGSSSPLLGAEPPPLLDPTEPLVPEPRAVTLEDLTLEAGPLARQVGLHYARVSRNGRDIIGDREDLKTAFPDIPVRDLSKAIAELEAEGLIEVTRMMGRDVPDASAYPDLYVTFDPVAFGTDPHKDALTIAGHVLSQARAGVSGFAARTLHETLGWPLRRFNPALGLVIAQIGEGRVSRSINAEYVTRSFGVTASDEVALERYAARLKG